MFSIKQFLINASSEVRQEIRKLIDKIEASMPAEVLAIEKVLASVKTKNPASKAETPAEK